MGFKKPSRIQAATIPLITAEPPKSIIVQAAAGSGKTGAFGVSTILRVDRNEPKTQILVMANTRELCNQIHAVYDKIIKGTGITLANFAMEDKKPQQIVISVHGSIDKMLDGRKAMDLSAIKCIVIDEADVFFTDEKNYEVVKKVHSNKHVEERQPQWILFSATYPSGENEAIQQKMGQIITQANQIKLSPASSMDKLKSIKQYVMKCEQGKKLDFIKEVFVTCEMTQTFIFVNTKEFAERVHNKLRKDGLKSYIMFSKMSKEERDSTMEKFRKQQINVLITTDLIARGIDVPEAQLVINFDVPQRGQSAEPDTYLHRIGRTGRFGSNGIALTIYDRDIDKQHLDSIIKHYDMASRINELQGADHLKQLLKELDEM
jgi:ATP-dependent RNA helicase DDX19/DBP5